MTEPWPSDELEGLRAPEGGVELLAVRIEDADVVDGERVARGGLVAVALLKVIDHELRRRVLVRDVNGRLVLALGGGRLVRFVAAALADQHDHDDDREERGRADERLDPAVHDASS